MATVVTKLFHIVEPTVAYFGQKDACQCVLIRRMVQDLDMGIDVQVQDTIRDADGLALSSRNAYLTAPERAAAPVVYRSLTAARALYEEQSSSNEQQQPAAVAASALRQAVESTLRQEPLVHEVQYVAVDSRETMRPLETVVKGTGAIISVACKVGTVRLIDNIVLT